MDFKIVDGLVIDLETGFTLVPLNVNGLGGGGVGALRELMDSNRSFPVMSRQLRPAVELLYCQVTVIFSIA